MLGFNRRWKVEVDDYGFADVEVSTGDLDGSGEAPGVQLEFEHEFSNGRHSLAMSAHEAERLSKALDKASAIITPAMRLRVRHRRLKEMHVPDKQPETQVPLADHVALEPEQADELLTILEAIPAPSERMLALIEQIRIPF